MAQVSPDPGFWSGKRVNVTGGGGFLGRPTVAMLEELGAEVKTIRSADYDLRDPRRLPRRPRSDAQVVIHLAANVGGIGYNRRNPGPLAHDNLAMGLNVFEACRKLERREAGRRLLGLRLSEVHPRPVQGGQHLGRLSRRSRTRPTGWRRRCCSSLSDSYRRQYGLDSCAPVMANLYGPGDNFDLEDSHVIAAMIHKYVVAAERGDDQVVLWGTGEPTREFLYVDDAARALILCAERLDVSDPVNIGTGTGDEHPRAGRDDLASSPASRGRPSGTTRGPTGSPSATSTSAGPGS